MLWVLCTPTTVLPGLTWDTCHPLWQQSWISGCSAMCLCAAHQPCPSSCTSLHSSDSPKSCSPSSSSSCFTHWLAQRAVLVHVNQIHPKPRCVRNASQPLEETCGSKSRGTASDSCETSARWSRLVREGWLHIIQGKNAKPCNIVAGTAAPSVFIYCALLYVNVNQLVSLKQMA